MSSCTQTSAVNGSSCRDFILWPPATAALQPIHAKPNRYPIRGTDELLRFRRVLTPEVAVTAQKKESPTTLLLEGLRQPTDKISSANSRIRESAQRSPCPLRNVAVFQQRNHSVRLIIIDFYLIFVFSYSLLLHQIKSYITFLSGYSLIFSHGVVLYSYSRMDTTILVTCIFISSIFSITIYLYLFIMSRNLGPSNSL